jgi:hypothetical protein
MLIAKQRQNLRQEDFFPQSGKISDCDKSSGGIYLRYFLLGTLVGGTKGKQNCIFQPGEDKPVDLTKQIVLKDFQSCHC